MCEVICRKATFKIPDATFPSSRAQNRGFCAFLAFPTLVFGRFEHKIGVFVRFSASEPSFSGISSTKSAFLCAFCLRNPCFWAFRAQNLGFCALLPFGTPILWHFEYKNGIFVSETAIFPWFWLLPSTKSAFLCAFVSKFLPDGTPCQQQTSSGREVLRFG